MSKSKAIAVATSISLGILVILFFLINIPRLWNSISSSRFLLAVKHRKETLELLEEKISKTQSDLHLLKKVENAMVDDLKKKVPSKDYTRIINTLRNRDDYIDKEYVAELQESLGQSLPPKKK